MLTAHVADKYQSNIPLIVFHDTESVITEGRLAISLVERWGMVSGADAGEDSQGRAKGRLLTPAEVVDRACETASLLLKAIRERGWTIDIPEWDEAKKLASDYHAKEVEEDDAERVRRAADRAAARSAK